MAKKKISFDIEEEDFQKIKLLIAKHKIGQGDLLRQAVKEYIEKLENEKNIETITIYVPMNNTIEKFVIATNDDNIKIELFDASPKMKELIQNIDKEGILTVTDLKSVNLHSDLKSILQNFGKVAFFTKKTT